MLKKTIQKKSHECTNKKTHQGVRLFCVSVMFLYFRQRLVQIPQNIVDIFDTDVKANHIGRNAGGFHIIIAEVGVPTIAGGYFCARNTHGLLPVRVIYFVFGGTGLGGCKNRRIQRSQGHWPNRFLGNDAMVATALVGHLFGVNAGWLLQNKQPKINI